jgi:hypothetical protein
MKLQNRLLALTAFTLFVIACAQPTTTARSPGASSARPTCDAIDHACDPHEDEGGFAKECHDLAESASTEEAVCMRRKAECLAACPPKS